MPQSIFYNSQLLRFTISVLDHKKWHQKTCNIKISCLCNARGGGTGPFPGRPLKVGPIRASPRAHKSAQARLHHRAVLAQAHELSGQAMVGPGQKVVSCRGPGHRASGCMAFYIDPHTLLATCARREAVHHHADHCRPYRLPTIVERRSRPWLRASSMSRANHYLAWHGVEIKKGQKNQQ